MNPEVNTQQNMPQDPNMPPQEGELEDDQLAAAMGFMTTLGEQQMTAEADANNAEMAETDEQELEAETETDPEAMKKELKNEMMEEVKKELKNTIKEELRALLAEEDENEA